MPSKTSLESASGSIEEALENLKLTVGAKDPERSRKLDKVLEVLRDVVSGPNLYVGSGNGEEQEVLWWEMFAEVFASEVAAQTRASGGKEPSPSCKRQILADVLVWAEVTQEHYDSATQRFVCEPHETDESFQRIGRLFRAVKARRGLGSGAAPGAARSSGATAGGENAGARGPAAGGGGGCSSSDGGARVGGGGSSTSSSGSDCSSVTRS